MNLIEQIKMYGAVAKADLNRICKERGIENDPFFSYEFTELHLEIAKEVYALWRTTKNFKVGDKVYVVPLMPTTIPTCIRARVEEVGTDGWGYRLRAFQSDLPGIFMFNMWDKDLKPRTSKAVMPTPPELLIE